MALGCDTCGLMGAKSILRLRPSGKTYASGGEVRSRIALSARSSAVFSASTGSRSRIALRVRR